MTIELVQDNYPETPQDNGHTAQVPELHIVPGIVRPRGAEDDYYYHAQMAYMEGVALPSDFLGDRVSVSPRQSQEVMTTEEIHPQTGDIADFQNLLKSEMTLVDVYDHWQGNQESEYGRLMVPLAWRTHAEGYLRTGLAKPPAIVDGLLSPVIDKSRHVSEGMTYYLAANPDNQDERSTARVIRANSVAELPTYGLTAEGISPDELAMLEAAVADGVQLEEVGALANSMNGYSKGSTEILRKIIADSVTGEDGVQKLLFCSMVDRARKGLMQTLAPANFEMIGEPTVLAENAYRQETTLVPLIIHPDSFVRNLFDAAKAAKSPSLKRRYLENALYFAEPLPLEHVPAEVSRIRAALGAKTLHAVKTIEG
jgi:hypothetical protein